VLQQLSYFFGVTATQLFLWRYSFVKNSIVEST